MVEGNKFVVTNEYSAFVDYEEKAGQETGLIDSEKKVHF